MAAISTLTDNFDDNTVDNAKWDVSAPANTTVTEQNQRIEMAHTSNGASAMLTSDATYDLTGDAVYVRLARLSGTTAHYMILKIMDAGGDGYRIMATGTSLVMQRLVSGEVQVGGTLTYNATTHGWWRIREAGGTIYGDTAQSTAADPPAGGDWTNRWSEATNAGVDVTAVKVRLESYVPSGQPSTIWFDGLNTATAARAKRPLWLL